MEHGHVVMISTFDERYVQANSIHVVVPMSAMKLFHTIHADRKQLEKASRKNAVRREETHHSCHAMQLSVNAASKSGIIATAQR